MKSVTWSHIGGAAALLGIAALPATAADNSMGTSNTTMGTTNSTINATYNTYASDLNVPPMPGASRVVAIQTVNDLGLKAEDIEKILPPLLDLQNEERIYLNAGKTNDPSLLSGSPRTKSDVANGEQYILQTAQAFRDRSEKIWETISGYIGTDRGASLRNLVQPRFDNNQFAVVWNQHQQTATQLLALLDQQAATRMAMMQNGTYGNSTVNTGNNGGNTTTDASGNGAMGGGTDNSGTGTGTTGNTGNTGAGNTTNNTGNTTGMPSVGTSTYTSGSTWWTVDQARQSLNPPASVTVADLVDILSNKLINEYKLNSSLAALPANWEREMNMPGFFALWERKMKLW